jgi:hypothetical protein
MQEEDEMRRVVLFTAGLLALTLVLAGAAFIAGRLSNQAPSESEQVVLDGPGDTKMVLLQEPDIAYAEEIPDSPARAVGLFARREDNRLFIQSGDATINIHRDAQGTVALETHSDGPEVEVVVTHDTQIFRDDTFIQYGHEAPSGSLQQVLVPGTLDEIGEHSSIRAWGERRGDRTIADLLVYTFPAVLKR